MTKLEMIKLYAKTTTYIKNDPDLYESIAIQRLMAISTKKVKKLNLFEYRVTKSQKTSMTL